MKPFISVDELLELQAAAEPPRLIDTRVSLDEPASGRRAYEHGHIPGAVYLDWLEDISDPDDPVAGQLAPPVLFAETMQRVGVGDDDLVVAYDDNVIFAAARLAWCLRSNGHDRVRVLHGGLPAWIAGGGAIESGRPAPSGRGTRFSAVRNAGIGACKDDVLAALESNDVVLVDCRMDETWNAAGEHIPGARRLPAPSLVDASGDRFVDANEVRRRAAAIGLEPTTEAILYCGGGVSASLTFLALEDAGFHNLRVYDGSWSEWSIDPSTPKEGHDVDSGDGSTPA
jgi:thiosulfate/3-mercaptopyruvate sulfurtransferase